MNGAMNKWPIGAALAARLLAAALLGALASAGALGVLPAELVSPLADALRPFASR